jgi:hypothetical protein
LLRAASLLASCIIVTFSGIVLLLGQKDRPNQNAKTDPNANQNLFTYYTTKTNLVKRQQQRTYKTLPLCIVSAISRVGQVPIGPSQRGTKATRISLLAAQHRYRLFLFVILQTSYRLPSIRTPCLTRFRFYFRRSACYQSSQDALYQPIAI